MKKIAVPAVIAGLLSAAAVVAAPAHADATSDAFINSLNNAGVGYGGDPGAAVSLGQSVCPMLSQPGGSFSSVASNVVGNAYGMSPGMASFFTGMAIQAFCPQVISSMANGNWINGLNGMNGMPGIPGMPGMPGLNGVNGVGGIPGIPGLNGMPGLF
ncbi:MAG: hypothetical protein QOG46_2717 [Pseudonocardiales bacterium]|nr:hypothetical protein [Pseudonocardiales bacterium]